MFNNLRRNFEYPSVSNLVYFFVKTRKSSSRCLARKAYFAFNSSNILPMVLVFSLISNLNFSSASALQLLLRLSHSLTTKFRVYYYCVYEERTMLHILDVDLKYLLLFSRVLFYCL